MKINEERQSGLEYKDKKTSIEVLLSGVDSAIATKAVNKWQEWKDVEARLKEARKQASLLAQEASEYKNSYATILRDLESKYFDVIQDQAKTKMIRTMSFLIRISKHSETKEYKEVDWEQFANKLIEVFNIPIEAVNDLLNECTKIEQMIPQTRLLAPIPLKDGKEISESMLSDVFTRILAKIKIAFNKILNNLKVCDSIIDRLEEQYL